MKRCTQKKLNKILKKHKKWLAGMPGGEQADLSRLDLSYLNFRYNNLRGANFENACLFCANFRGANLTDANLRCANARNVDLTSANLISANLIGADLRGANLANAFLKDAKLIATITNDKTSFYHLQCPEEGSFIGYKKCSADKIVKLLIPEDAKRSSATTRKCRCSKAKVLSITDLCGNELGGEAISSYDYRFVYRIGETVEVDTFCEDRWQECAAGIHFFMARQEAVDYIL